MRLFFALWPTGEARAKLATLAARAARDSQGKPVPAEKLHVTLAFLGEVAHERAEAARASAAPTPGSPFRLSIDRLGSFHGARVAWAGCSDAPPALVALQSQLSDAIRGAGFDLEKRPYTPHATLARKTTRDIAPVAVEPVEWKVESFVLVRSDTGRGTYTVMEEWRLQGR